MLSLGVVETFLEMSLMSTAPFISTAGDGWQHQKMASDFDSNTKRDCLATLGSPIWVTNGTESKHTNPCRQYRVVMRLAKDPEQFDNETYAGLVMVIYVRLLS